MFQPKAVEMHRARLQTCESKPHLHACDCGAPHSLKTYRFARSGVDSETWGAPSAWKKPLASVFRQHACEDSAAHQRRCHRATNSFSSPVHHGRSSRARVRLTGVANGSSIEILQGLAWNRVYSLHFPERAWGTVERGPCGVQWRV